MDPKKILENKFFIRKSRRFLYDYDPIGLKPCPEDEYEPERASICRRLVKCNGMESTQNMIHKEFVHWFGARLAGPPTHYKKLAVELHKLYKSFSKR